MSGYQQVATSGEESTVDHPIRQRSRIPRYLLFVAAVVVVVLSTYRSEQWSRVDVAPNSDDSSPDSDLITPPSTSTDMSPGGKYSVGYFVNWGIYGRKYPPSLIPVQDLTHILYAFADLKKDTGEVILSDVWADKDIHYPGDSWNDPPGYLYGNLKAIYNLKKQNRHLKVLLSIGGWTYSNDHGKFHPIVVSPSLRSGFVQSSIKLLEDYGFDGLDIDYEYPTNAAEYQGYLQLLKELREGLDHHQRKKGIDYKFLLTIAAPCGTQNYEKLLIREMDRYLDFWNLMAYDFAGSWDATANHQAKIGRENAPPSAAAAVRHYTNQGVAREKLILGIPLYGRSFSNTQGPGTPFNGVGQGSWERGVYDYRALPLPGSYQKWDDAEKASWSYNPDTHEMISYDNATAGAVKGKWIKEQGLGGSMFWELSGDKAGPRQEMEGGPGKDYQEGPSLIKVVKEAMGGLNMSPNWLQYEGSQYDNMRNGMPN